MDLPEQMQKVIIIDNNMRRQLDLKNLVDWNEVQCRFIGFAQNNKDAYRLYREVHPDIILIGVSGKRLDRIPLIHKIRRENENVQIILLMEGFSYFRVRSYVRSGINDLLLFSLLSKEGLQAAIEEAKVKAAQHRRRRTDLMEGAIRELQQCLLLRKEDHSSEVQDFESVLRHPFYDFVKSGTVMAYLRIDQIHLIHHHRKIDRKHLRLQLEKILRENKVYVERILSYANAGLVNLIRGKGELLSEAYEEDGIHVKAYVPMEIYHVTQVLRLVRSVLQQVKHTLNYDMTAIISDPFSQAQELMENFDRMLTCSRNRFYLDDKILLLQQYEEPAFQRLSFERMQFHQDLIDAVITQNFERAATLQKEMFSFMKKQLILPADVLSYCCLIVHNVEGRETYFGRLDEDFPFDSVSEVLLLCETLETLDEELQKIWAAVEIWLSKKGKQRYRKDVGEWMEYIYNNLHRPLRLQEIAEHFDVSQSYASRLFKKETGKTMIQFINEEKMKEAARFLNESSLSIRDVAARVGYDDPFYFDRLFRRFYGMTPRDYRRKLSSAKS